MDSQKKDSRYLIGFEVAFNKDVPGNPVAVTSERHKMDVELTWNGYDVPGLRHTLKTYARDTLMIKEYTEIAVVITFALELKENPNAKA